MGETTEREREKSWMKRNTCRLKEKAQKAHHTHMQDPFSGLFHDESVPPTIIPRLTRLPFSPPSSSSSHHHKRQAKSGNQSKSSRIRNLSEEMLGEDKISRSKAQFWALGFSGIEQPAGK